MSTDAASEQKTSTTSRASKPKYEASLESECATLLATFKTSPMLNAAIRNPKAMTSMDKRVFCTERYPRCLMTTLWIIITTINATLSPAIAGTTSAHIGIVPNLISKCTECGYKKTNF